MKKSIKPQNVSNTSEDYRRTVDIAETCPICGVAISPVMLYTALITYKNDAFEPVDKIFILNRCPHCRECFISSHTLRALSGYYSLDYAAPQRHFGAHFSENLQKLSPDFVTLYNEAAHAEAVGLTGICGMGYRKALEFLVKDFAISVHPEDTDKISSMPLAQCIEKYLSSPQLKQLAKASAWLGNDETHYTRKHMGYGINDLKKFVAAFVTYIDAELACLDAQALLSPDHPE